ncbi:MAG TPA: hypothetical protein PLD47_13760 [Aggregatilineales bacterium]|nr:hypothetical protein [Anaerolineales bacterium]HRE48787.1 hypothetical protein [Aggregatilineales bacterium]
MSVPNDSARTFLEKNPLLRYLNHHQPHLFRLVWEAYLRARQARPANQSLHPLTPILQARGWSKEEKHPPPVKGDSRHILFFSFEGWSTHIIFDGLLGAALRQRGVRVSHFTCGGVMPICNLQNASSNVPPMPCGRCRAYADSGLRAFGHIPTMIHHLLSARERAEIAAEVAAIPVDDLLAYTHDGLAYGHFASFSARWFFGVNQLRTEMREHVRNYIVLGRTVKAALERLIAKDRPHKIIMMNGLLVAERVVRALAEREGISYITSERGYLANTFMLSHNYPMGQFEFEPVWEMHRDIPLREDQRDHLLTYLQERRYGRGQMDNLWKTVQEGTETLRTAVGLSAERPVVGVFTNVTGDTALLDRDQAYSDMTAWIDDLIRRFSALPAVDLVFRIHPAESRLDRYRPYESVGNYIARHHPILPSNIKIIPSESTLSSYTLLEVSDLVMVYASNIGLESVLMGKQTVVSGQVHYRGKGFTRDVHTSEDMAGWIERWQSGNLPPIDQETAQRYAYSFFYRAMIPLDEVMEEGTFGHMRLKIQGVTDLRPGGSRTFDALCDSILDGTPFVNPFA